MSHRSSVIKATLFVLLFSWSVRAQETAPAKPAEDSAVAVTRKKAIDLLLSLAGQLDTLHSAENRARIGSNLAESLWNYDEKRSRRLLSGVQEDITSGLNDNDTNYESHRQTLLVFLQLRRDTLDRIAKHDPETALTFLRATRPPPDMQLPYELKDSEKILELHLAALVAAKNPELALKLGRQALAKGLSPDVISVLLKLRRKDEKTAQIFYREIVEKLKATNLSQNYVAMESAVELINSFQPPQANEEAYRELLGIILTSALGNGCGDERVEGASQICYEVGAIFSQIEKYFGTRAAPLRRWISDSSGGVGPQRAAWRELNEVMENGSIDEILALASNRPELEPMVYSAAVSKAGAEGNWTRARQIAAAASSGQLRENLLANIERAQNGTTINAEQLASLQQRLGQLRNDDERVELLAYIARQIGDTDRKAALGFLNQAGQIIDATKPGKKQLERQIGLAMMYCSLKSDRGFAIMESLMPKLNELVSAALALDGFENSYLRDGEWNMSGQGGVGSLLNALAQNAGNFARFDFDRSVILAGQFERTELRLMAQLKLAQSVLNNQPSLSWYPLSRRTIID
ncbi:MAG TPA: hypothetical protein DC047_18580 [Blastocatellia bacterium]|nr:hypothetical protein [Blastocatellia bacterium]